MDFSEIVDLLKYCARLLYKHLFVVCIFALLLGSMGWAYVLYLPYKYKTGAIVYVNNQSLLNEVLNEMTPDESSVDNEFLELSRRTILSSPNLNKLIDETDLALFAGTDRERVIMIEELKDDIELNAVSTTDRRRKNLINVSFSHSDPKSFIQRGDVPAQHLYRRDAKRQ